MQAKEWKPEYDTGIEWIDNQHRMFLRLINRLIEFKDGRLRGISLEQLLAEIEAYARFHFVSEENYMLEIEYPDLQRQREEHAFLLEQLGKRIREVQEDEENIVDLHMQMLTWLLTHTVDSDKDIGVYQRRRKTEEH